MTSHVSGSRTGAAVRSPTRTGSGSGRLVFGGLMLVVGPVITLVGAALFLGATWAGGRRSGTGRPGHARELPLDPLRAVLGHRPDRDQRLRDLGTVHSSQPVGAMKQEMASGCNPGPRPSPDRRHP